MQENNRVINTKKGKGKLPLFCGNRKRVINIFGWRGKRWGGGLSGGSVGVIFDVAPFFILY